MDNLETIEEPYKSLITPSMDDLETIIEKLKDMNPDYEHDEHHDVTSVDTDEYKELIKQRDATIWVQTISKECPFWK